MAPVCGIEPELELSPYSTFTKLAFLSFLYGHCTWRTGQEVFICMKPDARYSGILLLFKKKAMGYVWLNVSVLK